ncbi:hypothetical protein MTR_4g077430 [Medicago truncatula]|uniref:Ubiquitinyl hydrolase variant UBP zinc finger domain-containing protein n=1 Tax=Medicago truncatula TaxID=3880 RepID=G7JRP6_MEDTR|nr:hypothetical protein MTR_4g077430 [Medicago truncatula]
MPNLNDLLGNLSALDSLQGKRYLLEIYQNRVQIPEPNDRIHKNECSLSFDTPVSSSPQIRFKQEHNAESE